MSNSKEGSSYNSADYLVVTTRKNNYMCKNYANYLEGKETLHTFA